MAVDGAVIAALIFSAACPSWDVPAVCPPRNACRLSARNVGPFSAKPRVGILPAVAVPFDLLSPILTFV